MKPEPMSLPAPKKAAPAEFSLSNSEKRTFTTCRRKWYWQYSKKYSPLATPTPFLVGTAVHKVLEAFYMGKAVLDEPAINDIANAVFALCGPDLTHTTGLHVPVDAGVPAAFLR